MSAERHACSYLAAALSALSLLGCWGNTPDPLVSPDTEADLTWDLQGLEPLGAGYVYEAWVIIGGEPVSAGRFGVGAGGRPDLDGASLTPAEAAGVEAFVLSIEPAVGDDPAPSATKILGGPFVAGEAVLTIGHGAALGDDLSGAAGAFILETPTTGAIADDYGQGIWWLDPAAGPGPALVLPALPSGWTYEGWVVTGGAPTSTGRFRQASGTDGDGAGPGAGPDGAPPFPGQDFIAPPLDLVGGAAVISVEPEPDDSPAPFVLKPLVTPVIEDVGPGVLQPMENRSGTSPTGVATLS